MLTSLNQLISLHCLKKKILKANLMRLELALVCVVLGVMEQNYQCIEI